MSSNDKAVPLAPEEGKVTNQPISEEDFPAYWKSLTLLEKSRLLIIAEPWPCRLRGDQLESPPPS